MKRLQEMSYTFVEREVQTVKRRYLITGFIILLVLCAGVGIGLTMSRKENTTDGGQGVMLDKSAEGYTADDSDKEQSSIRFPGYPEITIESGSSRLPIVLTNPETNPCYFQFSVSLDGGTPIYESDWVKPGNAIRGFDLETSLEPGDYEMSIVIATRSLDTEENMNGGNIRTTLHVIDE